MYIDVCMYVCVCVRIQIYVKMNGDPTITYVLPIYYLIITYSYYLIHFTWKIPIAQLFLLVLKKNISLLPQH